MSVPGKKIMFRWKGTCFNVDMSLLYLHFPGFSKHSARSLGLSNEEFPLHLFMLLKRASHFVLFLSRVLKCSV